MKKIEKKYNLIIGRHCSVKKPEFLSGAVKETVGYGANALMFFLGSPRNSYRRTLEDSEIIKFKNSLKENNINIDNVVVHSSYLLNLANTVKEETFIRSVNALKKELVIMKKISLKTIVLHPGSSIFDSLTEKSLLKLVEGLNLTLKTNSDIRIALETMSGRRGEIGKNFEQLKFILDRIKKKKKVG